MILMGTWAWLAGAHLLFVEGVSAFLATLLSTLGLSLAVAPWVGWWMLKSARAGRDLLEEAQVGRLAERLDLAADRRLDGELPNKELP